MRKTFLKDDSGTYRAIIDEECAGSVLVVKTLESIPSTRFTPWKLPGGVRSIIIKCPQDLTISSNFGYPNEFTLAANEQLQFNGIYTPFGAQQVTIYFKPAATATVSIMYWIDTMRKFEATEYISSSSSLSSSSSG